MQSKICYYDNMTEELSGSITTKARKFIDLGCVDKIGREQWVIRYIPGYNKTDHLVSCEDGWRCSCQFNRKTGAMCSHITAVIMKRGKLK